MVQTRAVDAVLFDFSGTLFDDSAVLTVAAVREAAGAWGTVLDDGPAASLIEAALAVADSPEGLTRREGCDRSVRRHRTVWTELFTEAAVRSLPGRAPEALADALYACLTDPLCWEPYPDTAPVLTALHRAGVALGVVSNIGWDIRPTFEAVGIAALLRGVVLSCEHGVVKPEPELFEVACAELGVPAGRTLFVGDDPVRDGAASVVGMPVYLLPRDRAVSRPRGLGNVLALAGC
ncbi:HAD family hydrolase [Micromonospora sp. NPDC048898]|uniref:HAD family hydrolase n=1 Tax=Micromonospora sp. NPDC048898 TaxID=3364260 RepID=UPI0037102424